ncbi:unnamed protein product [Effrenium voratum]|uniref:EamA domain-containing protein n=1 Tax=Effrenium voratum TaxID=2562239 RepID=A0AA36HVR2_9DINO|nr:unnamed protein product [Effrenium voratum]
MAFFSSDTLGVWSAVVCAVLTNVYLLVSKWMQQEGWPFFFVGGLGAFCVALGLLALMAAQGTLCHLKRREVKWVILRGLFGCANNVLSVLATLAGAHIGSVGALLSVNTVVAALLGRLVLKEPLTKLHLVAVTFSLTGAVLISDPEAAFGGKGVNLGNVLALSAGVCLGCMFISSRKSGSASSTMLTASAMVQRWVVCWVLAFAPVVPDGQLELVWTYPEKFLLFLGICIVLLFLANLAQSMAAKLCPAALSSTLITGTQMVTGFLLDLMIFHKVPTALTLVGASLMFCAVITMALTRKAPAKAPRAEGADLPQGVVAEAEAPVPERESLASFVASEYVEREAPLSVPRQRLTILPTVLGITAAA